MEMEMQKRVKLLIVGGDNDGDSGDSGSNNSDDL